ARPLMEESVALFRRLDEPWGLGLALSVYGVAAWRLGEIAPARAALEESLAVLRPIGDGWATALALGGLGVILVSQCDYAGGEALRGFRGRDDRRGVAECLVGLAGVALAADRPVEAARLFGAGEALLEALGAPMSPENVRDYERQLAALRARLDASALGRAWG